MIQKLSNTGLIANNLIFVLADIIETCHKVSEAEAKKANLRLDKKTESALNMIRFGAQDLRRRTKEMGYRNQEHFGEESDKLLKLILTAIDKTEDNYKVIDLITAYAEAFQSRTGLIISKFGV
jgi:hypothetical protein